MSAGKGSRIDSSIKKERSALHKLRKKTDKVNGKVSPEDRSATLKSATQPSGTKANGKYASIGHGESRSHLG